MASIIFSGRAKCVKNSLDHRFVCGLTVFKNVWRRLRPGDVLELTPGELGTDVLTTPTGRPDDGLGGVSVN